MIEAASFVLDASALLAYLQDEAGASVVREALLSRTVINAVNWAEVLGRLGDLAGRPAEQLNGELCRVGLGADLLPVVPLTHDDAITTAELRPMTRSLGLSLGDRACLATGIRLDATVVTADRAWEGLSLGISIRVIR